MLFRNFFTPIIKETPQEATISSHILMLRSGMIRQLASGIYNWLPLGLKALRNVENIIRKTMNEAGAQEILMPCIQPASLWQESGRYDAYGKEMLRITDRHDNSLLFGPTNEEVVTDIFRKNVKSYKDLPMNLYHIQWKFRDEIRPRFGVMRGREFLMKDAYSFDIDFEGAKKSYDTMFAAYLKAFRRLGLNAIALRADSGAIGGNLSHEFHIVANTGESAIFYDKKFDELSLANQIDIETMKFLYAAADEMHDPANCPIPEAQIAAKRGIEVGHIFYFGTKYSESLGAYVTGKDGQQKLVEMGSYGIGVSRLVGAIIEANHDENGIIWPEEMAPFKYALINLKPGNDDCDALGAVIYQKFLEAGIDILYDDTDNSAGSKFATHDLIGTPWQFAIGPRSAANKMVEVKNRKTGEKIEMSIESLFNKFLGE